MSAIKGKDTKPEVYLRSLLFREGYRFRKNCSSIPGHPDIWMRKYNVALFVNGCFWHRHTNCKYAYTPKSNVEFWQKKFNNNIARDLTVRAKLKEKGIRCIVIWECSVRKMRANPSVEQKMINELISAIRNEELFIEI